MTNTLNDLKITDIIYCEHKSKCKWKGFALDGNGYGIGKVENYLQAWRDWHEKECGGKLIQAVIVKEDYLSIILAKIGEYKYRNAEGTILRREEHLTLQDIKEILK
jgi:hypothetical protein